MEDSTSVARYYDRNTGRFLRFGGGQDALAIHRELWGPGVGTPAEAKRYIHGVLAEEIERRAPHGVGTVLDLGCGVGGTLVDLAGRLPDARLHGVTVSPRQVEMGRDLLRRRGLAERCTIHRGDFQSPLALEEDGRQLCADIVLAIEAFAHASRPEAFFSTAARHLRPGSGRLWIVDDFVSDDGTGLDGRARKLVDTFREGWRLGPLETPECAARAAARAGLELVDDRDLTPLVRLGRPRDRIIRWCAPAFARLGLVRVPFFANMIGGNALQEGLRRGILSYRMLEFRQAS